jgi:hypothetical protein
MKRKFTLMMILLLLLGSFSFGQTAYFIPVSASPGEDVVVPLNVSDFTDIGIGAISLNILYNPDVLIYTGISDGPAGMLADHTGSTIHIAWSDLTPIAIDGELVNLHFVYNGPGTSQLSFLTYGAGKCEFLERPSNLPVDVTYNDGSVKEKTDNPAKLRNQINKLHL